MNYLEERVRRFLTKRYGEPPECDTVGCHERAMGYAPYGRGRDERHGKYYCWGHQPEQAVVMVRSVDWTDWESRWTP